MNLQSACFLLAAMAIAMLGGHNTSVLVAASSYSSSSSSRRSTPNHYYNRGKNRHDPQYYDDDDDDNEEEEEENAYYADTNRNTHTGNSFFSSRFEEEDENQGMDLDPNGDQEDYGNNYQENDDYYEGEDEEEEYEDDGYMENDYASTPSTDDPSDTAVLEEDVEETEEPTKRLLVIGVDGGTESIRACCFDAMTGQVVGQPCAVSYPTHHPHPGWAEQNPSDWYQCLGQAIRDTLESLYFPKLYQVAAICMDTTCCSVVALDAHYEPLRPSLLWMDQRSAPQTRQIVKEARGDPALLAVNGQGGTSLSAEWMTPKALWLFQNEYDITWQPARTLCEYQDYLNYKLTSQMTSSACNVATRWHWDAQIAVEAGRCDARHAHFPGRPMSLYQTLGMPDLAQKLPQTCCNMGDLVGYLTHDAARDMGGLLPAGLPVIQGGPDAFVGMIGLGCIGETEGGTTSSQLCLITGSSHLHCLVVPSSTTPGEGTAPSKAGMWGPYLNAPLPGLAFGEGGQSSTGSLLKWAKHKLFNDRFSYQEMDELATQIPQGSDGLMALETFQGSRTPVTDPLARGGLIGLTLSHTKAHIWRALMEGVCFGTRACLDALERATGQECETITLAGGITRSDLWLQMHADVTNKPIQVYGPDHNAPLLGCAILASVGIGIHPNIETAVRAMLPKPEIIRPNPQAVAEYDRIYRKVYSNLASHLRPIFHSIHGILHNEENNTELVEEIEEAPSNVASKQDNADKTRTASTQTQSFEPPAQSSPGSYQTTVSPSLLACDFGNIRQEVERCIDAGATRFHVDIFDGVSLNSPIAFTFGPDMVRVIAKAAHRHAAATTTLPPPTLDLHMCVLDPERFVEPMALVGASTFIFQWECFAQQAMTLLRRKKASIALAESIVKHKMKCGVSINPQTSIKEIKPLLKTGLVSVVDVLAVKPGFGGQPFQPQTLEKIKYLREWRDRKGLAFDIMVDGGVSNETAESVKEAGANILVSGSFLFKHPQGITAAMKELVA